MSGPWLQTALLCRKLSIDDTGRPSAIDVVEDLTSSPAEVVKLNLLIAVVRGTFRRQVHMRVMTFDPEGDPIASVEVEGDPPDIPYAQSRIVVPLELIAAHPGVYWFDVIIGGVTVTRVPLRIDHS
ncbi:MAG: hypothetical protein ABI867_15870 [Kofleriaceae bacterium]